MRQRHQPVERRTLRSHGTRGGGSDLVKVWNEVVRVAGMNVTTFTDSRSKCIGGFQTCPAPAAQISTFLHFSSTAVELPHIHVIHTAKHEQRCRSREAIPQPQGHVREKAISVVCMDWQRPASAREL